MSCRTVITGMGIVSPIGIGVDQFWKAAMSGESGISRIESFAQLPLDGYRSKVAGQVRHFPPPDSDEDPLASRVDRYAQMALTSSKEAIRDSGLEQITVSPERMGVLAGVGMGGMIMGERQLTNLYESLKPQRVHPNFIPTITLNSASGILALALGAKGPNLTVSTACSSSVHALGQALQCIRLGQADVMIAVGADASITPLVFAGFCSLRALSTKTYEHPGEASRPFDQGRDGFVMGEGAGTLILESLDHAKARGARIYAEVSGYAATSEAHHMVTPKEDGLDIARTMELALQDAHLTPEHVDYVNAHATSTVLGDEVEVKGLRALLGKRAESITINATKSLIGHTLGAAGAIATIASTLGMYTGTIHPTINYTNPDPRCALPGITNFPQTKSLRVGLVNAFGFGSNNAVLVVKAYP